MQVPVMMLALLVSALLQLRTGRSAFFWIARGAILADAALICSWRIFLRALGTWWRVLPSVIEEVKTEVAR